MAIRAGIGGPMARTKDPALEAARRQQVVEAVIALLSDSSWRTLTLDRVAERAGVSKGVVSYWFAGKDALVLAAVQTYHQQAAQRYVGIVMDSEATAHERLVRLVHAAFPSQAEVEREVRFQLEVLSYAKDKPAVAAEVRGAYEAFRLACEALLQIGVAEGYVDADNADGLYRYIHAIIDGLSIHAAFDPDVDMAALRQRLVALLERWFRG